MKGFGIPNANKGNRTGYFEGGKFIQADEQAIIDFILGSTPTGYERVDNTFVAVTPEVTQTNEEVTLSDEMSRRYQLRQQGLSFGEIAIREGVSKQAIMKSIKQAEKLIEGDK